MSIEEAIEAFEDMKKGIFRYDCRELCDMAIEALKKQKSCDECIFKNEWERIFSLIEERMIGDKEWIEKHR